MGINTYDHRGRAYPYHTPQQPHRGTERTKEWWGPDVGGDPATGEVVTEVN